MTGQVKDVLLVNQREWTILSREFLGPSDQALGYETNPPSTANYRGRRDTFGLVGRQLLLLKSDVALAPTVDDAFAPAGATRTNRKMDPFRGDATFVFSSHPLGVTRSLFVGYGFLGHAGIGRPVFEWEATLSVCDGVVGEPVDVERFVLVPEVVDNETRRGPTWKKSKLEAHTVPFDDFVDGALFGPAD